MNGRNARLARKAAQGASMQTLDAVSPVLEKAVEYTRDVENRVQALEDAEKPLRVSRLDYIGFKSRTLGGRLRWLILGR